MLSIPQMVKNIHYVVEQASSGELQRGLAWYAEAHLFAAALADRFNTSPRVAAAVIAALSPQISWERNILDAETFMREAPEYVSMDKVPVSATLASRQKAYDIMLSGDVELLHTKTGPKVWAFFQCINDPEHSDAVCVDRHAAGVAYGKPFRGKDEARMAALLKNRIRKRDRKASTGYERIAEAYRQAAQKLHQKPHQVQAITWLVWRRIHNGVEG